jgi:hypothetical protein
MESVPGIEFMTLPTDFWNQLSARSDEELYDMLSHEQDYQPEALVAAREELARRKLAPERVTALEGRAQSEKARELSKAEERLGWPLRIVIFVFCSGLVGAILAVYYDSKGYSKKASDCWITAGASLAFHVVVSAIAYAMR